MRRLALVLVALTVLVAGGPVAAAPEGQLTWAIHVSLAPTWFEPAETSGIITPFVVLYAMHDGLFLEQATEVDRKRREATLHRIQQLIHDKAMVAPISQLASMTGVGPRVDESGIGLVAGYAFFSAPYEDVKLKK